MSSLTVAICTLDRPDVLRRALESLRAQEDAGAFNVLVLDNSLSASSRGVFDAFAAAFAGGAQFVHISEPGLSIARNAGLETAPDEFVAYVDDDVTLPSTYIAALKRGLTAGCAGAGGPIRLAWPGPRPRWLLRDQEGFYSGLDLGPEERDFVIPPETPYGTNLVVNRQFAREVGGFDPGLGRVGTGLVGAEDMDMAIRLKERGPVRYLPEAWLYHHVEPERATRRWLLQRHFSQGRTLVRMAATGHRETENGDAPRLRRRPMASYVRFVRRIPYDVALRVGKVVEKART